MKVKRKILVGVLKSAFQEIKKLTPRTDASQAMLNIINFCAENGIDTEAIHEKG